MASYQAPRDWEDQVQSSVMGHHRPADLLLVVRSPTGCAEAPEALQVDVSDQAPASCRSSPSGSETAATPRQSGVGGGGWCLRQTPVRAASPEAGHHPGGAIAEGLRPVRPAGCGDAETPWPQTYLWSEPHLITFADRSAIEQVFHDVKEVWGSGQQQVRNLWANIACWHINLWLHTLTELWAWGRSEQELVHREDSPWDSSERRPSHADRRKALQAAYLEHEFSQRLPQWQMKQKFQTLLQRLLRITLTC